MEIENLAGVWPNVAINPATGKTYETEHIDTHEKLEADLLSLIMKWHDYDGNFMKLYSLVAYAQIKELLDRRAAIAEREFWEGYANGNHVPNASR